MLQRIHLKDFKSFADQSLEFGRVTVLVGANASGKSNLLDAIRFLQGVGSDLPIAEIIEGRWKGGKEVWSGIRGGLREVSRWGRKGFAIETSWLVEGSTALHEIACSASPHPLVERESLAVEGHGDYLFQAHAPSLGTATGSQECEALHVALRSAGGGRDLSARHPANRSLLGQIRSQERLQDSVLTWCTRLRESLSRPVFLDIRPSLMRDYVPRQVEELGAGGENISAVLLRLCSDVRLRELLVDWLSELCAPRIEDIDFVVTDLGDVLFKVVEADGTEVSAKSLSDGSLRFLGELTALLTAPPGSLLLIEEIENGLYPQRIYLLAQFLESIAAERDLQVIATTHSPLLLQALSPRTLGEAVVFARPSGEEGTIMRRLGDLPHFEEIRERRGIERLFTTGWLERSL